MKHFLNLMVCLLVISISACTNPATPAAMQTPEPTISITPTKFVITYEKIGSVERHEKNDQIKYTWFSYVPRSINKIVGNEPIYILILCANATMSGDYKSAENYMEYCLKNMMGRAESHKFILLTPVIPRDLHAPIYAVAFDKRIFTKVDPFFQRPDLEVVKMVEILKQNLEKGRIVVKDKIFIEGFSAGGMFAQRFALLHPELVKAIAVGQSGGALTLPVEEYKNRKMDWPLGIYGFEQLTGNPFNMDAYKNVSQFIYIGSDDNNNSTVQYGNEIWNNSQVNTLNMFGKTDPIRIKSQVDYLHSIDLNNIHFKLYPGYKHSCSGDQVADLLTFFEKNK